MEREQYQQIAVGAGLLAVVVAITTGRLPRWLRITLVIALAALAGGAGLFAYRYISNPTTLTVAAGSLDGDVPRIMAALASRMASTNSAVRLKVIEKGTALEAAKACSAGEVDLAAARADTGDLSAAQTVVVVTRSVVLIVAPPGSSIEGMDDLIGKTVGVVGGEMNRRVVQALKKEYDLDRAKVQFKGPDPGRHPAGSQVQASERLARRYADYGKISGNVAEFVPAKRQIKSDLDTHRVSRSDCGCHEILRKLRPAEGHVARLASHPRRRSDNPSRTILSCGEKKPLRGRRWLANKGNHGDTSRSAWRISIAKTNFRTEH